MEISVVIPVYKKTEMFLAYLKENLHFLTDAKIIVVNDDPEISIKQRLSQWSQIQLIENTHNLGFASSVHTGIQQVQSPYVMLLNSDVKLRDNSYIRSLNHFKSDNKLFAVSFAQVEKNGETVGKNIFYWQNGFFQHSRANNLDQGPSGWAEGGSCIIDLAKYNKIGGFDSIYSPFYWEDIDLSYRAWKQGYTILFDPSVLVEHHHESTIKSYFSTMYITSIAYRNQLLFIWKNIRDTNLLNEHNTALFKQLIRSIATDPAFISGYFRALAKKNDIINSTNPLLSDHEILAQFTE